MAGLSNGIRLDQFLRRCGVKGAVAEFPIVPGLFPVLVLHDVSDQISTVRRRRCIISDQHEVTGGQTDRWRFQTPFPTRVERITVQLERDTNEILIQRLPPPLIFVPNLTRMDVDADACAVIGRYDKNVGAPAGVYWMCDNRYRQTEVNWELNAGDTLEFYSYARGSGSRTCIELQLIELPAGKIEP